MDLKELKIKLEQIKQQGFVKTHRVGDTGIGKTLEDLLDIPENNIPLHDIAGVAELKAYRKDAKSMLTLFTLEPLPKAVIGHCLIILVIRKEITKDQKSYIALFRAKDITTNG